MSRYPTKQIEVYGQSLSQTMASRLLEMKRGKEPRWPDRMLLAMQNRGFVYPDSDHNDRFMLTDLGERVASALEEEYR